MCRVAQFCVKNKDLYTLHHGSGSNWLNHDRTAPSIQIEPVPPKPPRKVVSNRFWIITHAHANLHVTFKLCLLCAWACISTDGTLDETRVLVITFGHSAGSKHQKVTASDSFRDLATYYARKTPDSGACN